MRLLPLTMGDKLRLPFAETRDTEAGEELRTTPVALLRGRPQATRDFLATIAIPRPGAADLEKTGAGEEILTLDPVLARHGVLMGAVMAEPGDVNGGYSPFGTESDRSGPDPIADIANWTSLRVAVGRPSFDFSREL